MNKSGRGRRTGKPETRQQILDVARRRFLAHGYQAVTLRSVAADAGVDVALISYFFGSKKGLFGASLAPPANPPEVLLGALAGDPETLPERILRVMVSTWDAPEHGRPLRVMLGAAIQDPALARLLKEMLEQEMLDRIADRLGGADARFRAAALMTHLGGVIVSRYVLEVEPIATMSVDELIRYLGPGLRAVLRSPERRR
jgi:AcrR family transcriptional regulator